MHVRLQNNHYNVFIAADSCNFKLKVGLLITQVFEVYVK